MIAAVSGENASLRARLFSEGPNWGSGLGTVFCLQTLLIIGGVTRLIPLTGVTLPFMSYGGSSLLANFVMIALLLRVSDDLATQSQTTGWTPGYDAMVALANLQKKLE